MEARRSLKRRLSDDVYRQLLVDAARTTGYSVLWCAFVATLPALDRTWLRAQAIMPPTSPHRLRHHLTPMASRPSNLYLTPPVPFMALGVALALQRLRRASLPGAAPPRWGGDVPQPPSSPLPSYCMWIGSRSDTTTADA